MSNSYISVDKTCYLEPLHKDLNYEHFFNKNFRQDVERIKYKYIPFNLYTNYKVYIKCQILYFLYLNQHQKFTITQITKPIINFVMKCSKFAKREEVEVFCINAVVKLAENFTIFTEKCNKTKFNKYFFNTAYEQLFSYDLFWNKAFIAEQLENRKYFHINRILKFVKILDFIGNKNVSSQEIANSYLFGYYPTFKRQILNPLIKMGLIKRFKQGRDYFYCLNTNNNFPREIKNIFLSGVIKNV